MRDLEDAAKAYERVRAQIETQDPKDLSAYNVDISNAASVALGVAPRIVVLRNRAVALPEFEIRCVDNLTDYAKAVWYLYITNLPPAERSDGEQMLAEVLSLRAKMLLWAEPLAASGKFARAAVDKIKEGAGHKDAASDVVALVALYRSVWSEISTMCGVTEADLDRGAVVGPAVFAMLSRKESEQAGTPEATLRLKQAWTLLDRAYRQCQRAVGYLRFDDGDADTYAPSLRHNSGVRPAKPSEPPPPAAVTPAPSPAAPAPAVTPTAPAFGGGGAPFVTR
jgi:hypothetical protein